MEQPLADYGMLVFCGTAPDEVPDDEDKDEADRHGSDASDQTQGFDCEQVTPHPVAPSMSRVKSSKIGYFFISFPFFVWQWKCSLLR